MDSVLNTGAKTNVHVEGEGEHEMGDVMYII